MSEAEGGSGVVPRPDEWPFTVPGGRVNEKGDYVFVIRSLTIPQARALNANEERTGVSWSIRERDEGGWQVTLRQEEGT